jgi:hypothetical protein
MDTNFLFDDTEFLKSITFQDRSTLNTLNPSSSTTSHTTKQSIKDLTILMQLADLNQDY